MQRIIFNLQRDRESFFSVVCQDIFNDLLMFVPNAPQVANPPRYRKHWRMRMLDPEYFCADNDGNLLVATNGKVNAYDSRTGKFLRQFGPFKNTPNAIAVDYRGAVYVAVNRTLHVCGIAQYSYGVSLLALALRKDHRVIYIAAKDCVMEVFVSSGIVKLEHYTHCTPCDMVVLSTNEIVILSMHLALLRFDHLFGYIGRMDLTEIHIVSQIAVDANDYVYVSNCNNYIDVFDVRLFSYVSRIGCHGAGAGKFTREPCAMTILPSGVLVVGAEQLRTVQFFR